MSFFEKIVLTTHQSLPDSADPALGCFGQLNYISTSVAIPSWAALILFDTTVFLLTVFRVSSLRREKKDASRLLHILFRDGE